MIQYRQLYCASCKRVHRFRKPAPDHRLHFRFTLLTLGLWGIGWLVLTLLSLRRHWRCPFCHARPRLGHLFDAPPFAVWPTPPAEIAAADSPAAE